MDPSSEDRLSELGGGGATDDNEEFLGEAGELAELGIGVEEGRDQRLPGLPDTWLRTVRVHPGRGQQLIQVWLQDQVI